MMNECTIYQLMPIGAKIVLKHGSGNVTERERERDTDDE
jgi:hypothetical protein